MRPKEPPRTRLPWPWAALTLGGLAFAGASRFVWDWGVGFVLGLGLHFFVVLATRMPGWVAGLVVVPITVVLVMVEMHDRTGAVAAFAILIAGWIAGSVMMLNNRRLARVNRWRPLIDTRASREWAEPFE